VDGFNASTHCVGALCLLSNLTFLTANQAGIILE